MLALRGIVDVACRRRAGARAAFLPSRTVLPESCSRMEARRRPRRALCANRCTESQASEPKHTRSTTIALARMPAGVKAGMATSSSSRSRSRANAVSARPRPRRHRVLHSLRPAGLGVDHGPPKFRRIDLDPPVQRTGRTDDPRSGPDGNSRRSDPPRCTTTRSHRRDLHLCGGAPQTRSDRGAPSTSGHVRVPLVHRCPTARVLRRRGSTARRRANRARRSQQTRTVRLPAQELERPPTPRGLSAGLCAMRSRPLGRGTSKTPSAKAKVAYPSREPADDGALRPAAGAAREGR